MRPDPERPQHACLLCRPPADQQEWRPADPGYRTCEKCVKRLRSVIADIRDYTGKLNPRPGGSGGTSGRGAPGFGSRPPASLHVIAMLDRHSKPTEVSWDCIGYSYDPYYRHTLPDGVEGPEEAPGAYTRKGLAWKGDDGRLHYEQERPPRSVYQFLAGLAAWVAEEAGVTPPTGGVDQLLSWLDVWCDFVTRHDWVVDIDHDLRTLRAQLKPHAGEGQHHKILDCPNTVDEGDHTRLCGAPLYEPDKHGVITCHQCRRSWDRAHWEGDGPDYLKQTGDASLLRERAERVSRARRRSA